MTDRVWNIVLIVLVTLAAAGMIAIISLDPHGADGRNDELRRRYGRRMAGRVSVDCCNCGRSHLGLAAQAAALSDIEVALDTRSCSHSAPIEAVNIRSQAAVRAPRKYLPASGRKTMYRTAINKCR